MLLRLFSFHSTKSTKPRCFALEKAIFSVSNVSKVSKEPLFVQDEVNSSQKSFLVGRRAFSPCKHDSRRSMFIFLVDEKSSEVKLPSFTFSAAAPLDGANHHQKHDSVQCLRASLVPVPRRPVEYKACTHPPVCDVTCTLPPVALLTDAVKRHWYVRSCATKYDWL